MEVDEAQELVLKDCPYAPNAPFTLISEGKLDSEGNVIPRGKGHSIIHFYHRTPDRRMCVPNFVPRVDGL